MSTTTTGLTVRVPCCPYPELSPNARVHHMERAKSVRAARLMAKIFTDPAPPGFDAAHATVRIAIGWSKGRKEMDGDNALASCKAFLDGVADGLGVTDKRWTYPPVSQVRAGKNEPSGYVEITLQEAL